jgi:anti-repressor protein
MKSKTNKKRKIMNDIQIFNNPQFGDIRTVGTANNPMFCLSDICKVLDLQTNKVKARLNERGVTSIPTPTHNQFGAEVIQEMIYVNEQNLYKVIMRSDKPQAEPFQDWVCGEVLPSIRKHGMYATDVTIKNILEDPDNFIQMMQAYQRERKERMAAQQEVERLEAQEIENKPKVVYADAVAGSRSACLIGELAKMIAQNGYPIGEKRLFQWLRDNHYLCSYGERFNQPYQQYIEQGLFTMKQSVFSVDGEMRTRNTTKVTGKGQVYFINKFLGTQAD